MPHINWKSVSYIINYYLTQWTDNRMPDKRGTDNLGSTVFKNGRIACGKMKRKYLSTQKSKNSEISPKQFFLNTTLLYVAVNELNLDLISSVKSTRKVPSSKSLVT